MDAKRVTFRGWSSELPKRAPKRAPLSEHDILRIVILAESDERDRWVEFQCEDNMHAVKVAKLINTFGFEVIAVSREDSVYVRQSQRS